MISRLFHAPRRRREAAAGAALKKKSPRPKPEAFKFAVLQIGGKPAAIMRRQVLDPYMKDGISGASIWVI
jgi:hypothetical protein